MKITFTLLLFAATLVLSAQQQTAVFPESSSATGVQQMFYKTSIVKNAANDVFTCGATLNGSGSYDMLVTKHNSANVLQWSVTYNGSYGGDDYASDIALDALGNVYVTGTKQTGTQNYDAVLNKYNNAGTLLWSRAYAGSGNGPDGFTTVLVENNNAIYVAGGAYISLTNLTDVLSIKYDSSGTALWTNTWNNSTSSMQDAAVRIVNSGGQTYVYSASQTGLSPVVWKLAQPRYNSTTGAFVAAGISSGDDTAFSNVSDIAVDGMGHVLVAGTVQTATQGKNIRLARFNLSLIEQWVYDYNGSGNLDDEGAGLVLVGTAHAYLTGYTTSAGNDKDLFAAKIAITSGAVSWDHELDLSGGADRGVAISLDAAGNAYIGATSFKHGNDDMVVAVLASSTGNLLASNRYNSPHNLNDHAQKIALDQTNNEIFMAGQVETTPGSYSYMLTKWSVKTVYAPVPAEGYSSTSGYITNNGQLQNADTTSNYSVSYYNQDHRVATYLTDSLVIYQLYNYADSSNQDTLFQVNMSFKGASLSKLRPFQVQDGYRNYYLSHMASPSKRTLVFNSIIQQNLYNNIDFMSYYTVSGFQHCFVARSGANLNNIHLEFNGQNNLSVDGSGILHVGTSIGDILYSKAKVYSMNNQTGVLSLLNWQPTFFVQANGVVLTNLSVWSGTIVIVFGEISQSIATAAGDPRWSTFFGGNSEDLFYDVVSPNNGKVFACGATRSSLISGQIGEYITDHVLDLDMVITKFDQTVHNTWITFIGSWDIDIANTIAINPDEEVYIGGLSTGGYINYELGNYNELNVDEDNAVLVKLSSMGEIVWDGYVGGNGKEAIRDLVFDNNGGDWKIYAVGVCEGPTGFVPATTNSGYQQTYSEELEAFIIQLGGAEEATVEWSTFFGGEGADVITEAIVLGDEFIATGVTESQEYSSSNCSTPVDGKFPFCNEGGWVSEFSTAQSHSFIAGFNKTNHELTWSTITAPSKELGQYNWVATETHSTISKGTMNVVGTQIYLGGILNVTDASEFPIVPYGSYNVSSTFGSSTQAYLMSFNAETPVKSLLWSTFLTSHGNENHISVAGSNKAGYIAIAGGFMPATIQNESDWCTTDLDGNWPICDAGGYNYLEFDAPPANLERSYILFLHDGDLQWSTQYGNGNMNRINSIFMDSDYLYFAGDSRNSWTLFDRNIFDQTDYFMTEIGTNDAWDATIARFPLYPIVSVNEVSAGHTMSFMSLFPNPSNMLVNVSFEKPINCKAALSVFDMTGKLCSRNELPNHSRGLVLNIEPFAPGLYFVVYTDDLGRTQSLKLTIK